MFRCVTIRGTVATPGHAAGLTGAQMDPTTANLDALVTLEIGSNLYFRNRLDVCANFFSHGAKASLL